MLARVEIRCPQCGGEHVKPKVSMDADYQRSWIDASCSDCGCKLSYEEIGRQVVQQIVGQTRERPSR